MQEYQNLFNELPRLVREYQSLKDLAVRLGVLSSHPDVAVLTGERSRHD